MNYNFTKAVATDRLTFEIQISSITKALDYITTNGTALSIFFKEALSESEEATLGTLVTNHVATPLPENVIQKISVDGVAEPVGKRARLKGVIKGTIPAGTEVDLDYKMEQISYKGTNRASIFDGIEYFAKDATSEDEVTFQVVDKDNLLGYGANTVLEEFANKWFISPDTMNKILLYRSAIAPNFYIRAKYKSYGATDVLFTMNLFRHLVE
jgi:hypothetical protein